MPIDKKIFAAILKETDAEAGRMGGKKWGKILRGKLLAEEIKRNPDVVNVTCTFNPRLKGSDQRLTLIIKKTEAMLMPNRGLGVHGVVTDLNTGKQYLIRGARCGLGCNCDATAEFIESA